MSRVERIRTMMLQILPQNRCSKYRIMLEQNAGKIYRELPDETGKRTDLTSSDSTTKFTDKQKAEKETGKDVKKALSFSALPGG